MELKFTKEQMCQILEKYFKEQLDIAGKVNIKTSLEQVGFEMYPTTKTLIKITIDGTMNIEGLQVPVKQEVPQTELENAFQHFLNARSIEVESLSFDKGVSTKSVGYYKSETTIKEPYFRGVIVKTKNITKRKGEM